MANVGLITDFYGGPGTGALGGPPSGHNYKRAVYRAPPKEFSVEVLPPTKFGSGYCYGMRITALSAEKSDAHSTTSGASSGSGSSFSEYEVWRRWEDCLWFQEILETEYALMAREKRARLAAGKGVKKNGVYNHSNQAASFESLPPGPDAKMIAKDIHDVVPRLTKKGTLFRASQATIEQRGKEFEALIGALFQEDVPTLVKELREARLCRDFFGYWRRDLDHDRKRGKARQSTGGGGGNANGTMSARNSVASSAFSMYFSASNISLQLPNAFSDLPPSPAIPAFQETSRPSSMIRDDAPQRRSFGKAPVQYATSDSSTSTASSSRSPTSATSAPHDMTFFVSERGSLALALPEDDPSADYYNVPLSAPARVQPAPWADESPHAFPTEDEIGLPEEVYLPDHKVHSDTLPSEFHHGLQALPEDTEFVPAAPSGAYGADIQEVPRVPVRRQRNNSCPDRTNRNCIVFSPDAPRSAGPTSSAFTTIDGLHLDTDPRRLHAPTRLHHDRGRPLGDPQTPTTATTSSRAPSSLFSSFSTDASRRSSWRSSVASITSETSFTPSFTSSFANGSCADFSRPRVASPESLYSVASDAETATDEDHELYSDGDGRETALGFHRHRESVTTIGSMLSDLSIDSSILPRSLTPPPGGHLRRSLSAGSRGPGVLAGLGVPGSEELWYEQQEDLIDAYFYDPGILSATPAVPVRPEEPPRTPLRKPPQEPFHKEVATPDRFPKPFRDRPPGQFHLPWSPQDQSGSRPSTPSSSVSASSPTTSPTLPSAQPTAVPMRTHTTSPPPPPPTPGAPAGTENVTLKAVLNASIVLLRVSRGAPLAEVRERLRDKFAGQEGVKLTPSFVIGWAPPSATTGAGGPGGLLALRGRPRSNSASSVGSMSPQALRYVYSEQDWQTALASCTGGKMTVRLFNARPI